MVYCKLDVLIEMVSCKVTTIENQQGYQTLGGNWGAGSMCRVLGVIWGVGGVRVYWQLAGSVGAQSHQVYKGHMWALGAPRGVESNGGHQKVSGVHWEPGRECRYSGPAGV